MMRGGEKVMDPGAPHGHYPLRRTAALLNTRLGLYLSDDQQRGLATGLLFGAAAGGAIVAWSIVTSLRTR